MLEILSPFNFLSPVIFFRPKITCTEAQTKLTDIARLKDEFVRTLDYLMEMPPNKGRDIFVRLVALKQQLENKMEVFARELEPNPNIYPVTIDYTLSYSEMITRGAYDWVKRDINNILDAYPPMKEKGVVSVDLELIEFDIPYMGNEILAQLNARGFEPAKIEHILAFGAEYPEKQCELPIIALGFRWKDENDELCVLRLDEGSEDGRRILNAVWFRLEFSGHNRFLVYRP